ncbi:MAG TPA: hypothetical protein VFS41_05735 [Edaphobacter sp.]|nr:hypothetical protein [Edaphobacter sp.]
MNKLSNAQIAEVLTDASATLRHQQVQIQDLQEKLAARERRDRAEKLASEMHRKGLELDVAQEALVDRLEKTAEAGKLDAVEHAVDLVGPDMGAKLAQIITNDTTPGSSSGGSDLERFLVGSVG